MLDSFGYSTCLSGWFWSVYFGTLFLSGCHVRLEPPNISIGWCIFNSTFAVFLIQRLRCFIFVVLFDSAKEETHLAVVTLEVYRKEYVRDLRNKIIYNCFMSFTFTLNSISFLFLGADILN